MHHRSLKNLHVRWLSTNLLLFIYLNIYFFIILFFYLFLTTLIAAKKGSIAIVPGSSCKDIVRSGDAQGDGEYWIDPTASGDPFTVFCDMVTDRGKIYYQKSINIQTSDTILYLNIIETRNNTVFLKGCCLGLQEQLFSINILFHFFQFWCKGVISYRISLLGASVNTKY